MSRPERPVLAVGMVLAAAVWVGSVPSGTTYAAWSDYRVVPGAAGAGVWLTDGDPALPDQCLGMAFDRIMVGSNKDEVLTGTSGNDLVFGLQGKDVLHGLGGDDCLVGGNGKDELLGGDGDDVLVGGNAKDKLSGGADDDVCDGGRGRNTLIQCETPEAATATLFSTTTPLAPETESVVSVPLASAETIDEPVTEPAPATDGGASVEEPPEAPLVESSTPVEAEPDLNEPESPLTPGDEVESLDEVQP